MGLRPFACWDWGFEYRRVHGCLVRVLCVVRGLCDGSITRPDESYRVWRFRLIAVEEPRRGVLGQLGLLSHDKKKLLDLQPNCLVFRASSKSFIVIQNL